MGRLPVGVQGFLAGPLFIKHELGRVSLRLVEVVAQTTGFLPSRPDQGQRASFTAASSPALAFTMAVRITASFGTSAPATVVSPRRTDKPAKAVPLANNVRRLIFIVVCSHRCKFVCVSDGLSILRGTTSRKRDPLQISTGLVTTDTLAAWGLAH